MPCRGKPMNEHLSGETLAGFADGRLAAGARRAAEAHLSLCRECRQELAELVEILAGREAAPDEFVDRALEAAGQKAPRPRPAPGARVLFLRPAFGVAAVFLVAVVAGYFFLGRVQPPPAGERALPGPFLEHRAESAPAERSPLKDAPAADEVPSKRGGAALPKQNGTMPQAALKKGAAGSGVSGKEAPAAVEEEKRRVAPAVLAEATSAAPAVAPRFQESDKREAAKDDGIAGGAVGGVIGGLEQAQEKSKLASAPEPRRRDLEAMPQAETRWDGAGDAGAVAGARQLFLAASGRAAAPPSLELVELAAGPIVSVEGDVAAADVLSPGLRDARAWLPAGAAVEVTIGAGGEVTSVRLLGEWRSGAAARARAAAAQLEFPPSSAPERRAVISRPRVN